MEVFTESDWYTFGQICGKLDAVTGHPRLLRSMGFGDPDYEYSAAQVVDSVLYDDSRLIGEVIQHFDIDLWYQQKSPDKYQRIFVDSTVAAADFWTEGQLRLFVSHLSSNKARMSALKADLARWGISAFVAHEDIEPSREWMDEVEAGLETMEVMLVVVEPGFKESDWCPQEVGFALGRKIDILPLRAGLDPFGFFGKFQGIQIKGKLPKDVANEIVRLLLKKPKHRDRLIQCIGKAFSGLQSNHKTEALETLESWSVVTETQMRALLESSSLSEYERQRLKALINRVGAFKSTQPEPTPTIDENDVPF